MSSSSEEEKLKKCHFFVEKCKKMDELVDCVAKAINETHKAHKELVELLESFGPKTSPQNALLISSSFREAVPHLQTLKDISAHARSTCERAVNLMQLLGKSVLQTEHYEDKLGQDSPTLFGVFHGDRGLDWVSRNEWKLANAKSDRERMERELAEMEEYLRVGVGGDMRKCMHAYMVFFASFAGSAFFDLDLLSGQDKYRLVARG